MHAQVLLEYASAEVFRSQIEQLEQVLKSSGVEPCRLSPPT